MNGIICPKCMLSLLGPRPVYRKNGFPCSYRSRILSNSLQALLTERVTGQSYINVPMRKEHPAAHQHVRTAPCQSLKPLEQRCIDSSRSELIHELLIVDGKLLPVARHGALHVPGRHNLCVRLCISLCGFDLRGSVVVRRRCGLYDLRRGCAAQEHSISLHNPRRDGREHTRRARRLPTRW